MTSYQFSYEPDEYQKRSFNHILQNEHVFVSVPTGAGKTTVAEFAIAKCLEEGKSIIYTAPIKALCNQKFYDFQIKFNSIQTNQNDEDDFYYHKNESNIGILTGDVKENENAGCLVMTTEVLRNMIFQKNDYLDNVAWIIFDEVHYISNEERGQVWEEVIQWSPEHIRFIFLSATSPNRDLFCKWVSDCRKQPIHIESHEKRPVPLDFWIYFGTPSNPDTEMKWENGWFHITGESQLTTQKKIQEISKGKFMNKDRTGWTDFVRKLETKDMLPAVFFGFQKKRIENACDLMSHLTLTTKKQQYQINKFLKETYDYLQLTPEQQQLPQVRKLTPLLLNGIGFHHSGLLPFLKEIVEVLFSKGLIKILWATETFAMGLNMPTRTVVFSAYHKWDGRKDRLLDASEWLQMAGRAGRRGFDSVGYVIIPADEKVNELNELLWAQPKPMKSYFEASYATILHNLSQEDKQSFKSFRDYLMMNEMTDQNKERIRFRQLHHLRNNPLRTTDLMKTYRLLAQITQPKKSIQQFTQRVFSQAKYVLVNPDELRVYPVLCRVISHKSRTLLDMELNTTFDAGYNDILAICKENGKIDRKIYGKIPFDLMSDISDFWNQIECIEKQSYTESQIKEAAELYQIERQYDYLASILGEQDHDVIRKCDWLKKMGYIHDDEKLTLKGKIAQRIHSTHPILMTECLLSTAFKEASMEACICVLSNFTVPRPKTDTVAIPEECIPLNELIETITKETVEQEKVISKETEIWLDTYTEKYEGIFMMFAKGCSFCEWTERSGWEEGLLIRWALRTEEMCRELQDIFENIGNLEISQKCEKMRKLIKRDLVETRSIYW